MRMSKVLGSLFVVGVAVAAVTLSTPSKAGDEGLVKVACAGGEVTVTPSDANAFHINKAAPWKWDKGNKVSVDDHAAKFKGSACEGTVSAYVCNNDQSQCKSFKVAVK